MGLNIYGELTEEMEKKITNRLIRAGFILGDQSWKDVIDYLQASGETDEYRRAMFIFCRSVGMKPTLRASWGWGYYGVGEKI